MENTNKAISTMTINGTEYMIADKYSREKLENHTHDEYLTEHQSLENYAKKAELPDFTLFAKKSEVISEIPSEYITESELDAKGYATGGYVDSKVAGIVIPDLTPYAKKTDIPTVPTKVSQLTNDSNYLTEVPIEYVTEIELNAKGYLTQHQSLSEYAKKTDIQELPIPTSFSKTGTGSLTIKCNRNLKTKLQNCLITPSTSIFEGVPSILNPLIATCEPIKVMAHGKNIIYPYFTSREVNNRALTVNADGTITSRIVDNNEAVDNCQVISEFTLFPGNYTISGSTKQDDYNYNEGKYNDVYVSKKNDDGTTYTSIARSINGSEETFKIEKEMLVRVTARVGKNAVDTTLYPMLRRADEDSTYEPFKPSVTSEFNNLYLYGIGYTKDSLDLVTGELIRRIGIHNFNGTDKEGYDGYDWKCGSTKNGHFYIKLNNNADSTKNALSNRLTYNVSKAVTTERANGTFWLTETNSDDNSSVFLNVIIEHSSGSWGDTEVARLTNFKDYLKTNRLTIAYHLKTPTIQNRNETLDILKDFDMSGTTIIVTNENVLISASASASIITEPKFSIYSNIAEMRANFKKDHKFCYVINDDSDYCLGYKGNYYVYQDTWEKGEIALNGGGCGKLVIPEFTPIKSNHECIETILKIAETYYKECTDVAHACLQGECDKIDKKLYYTSQHGPFMDPAKMFNESWDVKVNSEDEYISNYGISVPEGEKTITTVTIYPYQKEAYVGIQCSQFVNALLQGLPFENSRLAHPPQSANDTNCTNTFIDGGCRWLDVYHNRDNGFGCLGAGELANFAAHHGWFYETNTLENCEVGDVLCFSSTNELKNSWRGIGHVGMVVAKKDGKVYFIQAGATNNKGLAAIMSKCCYMYDYYQPMSESTKGFNAQTQYTLLGQGRDKTKTLTNEEKYTYTYYSRLLAIGTQCIFDETKPFIADLLNTDNTTNGTYSICGFARFPMYYREPTAKEKIITGLNLDDKIIVV
jgi:hypothetical protein